MACARRTQKPSTRICSRLFAAKVACAIGCEEHAAQPIARFIIGQTWFVHGGGSKVNAMNIAGPGADSMDRARADDQWLDEALADSFPASDPLPLFHYESRPAEREDDGDSASVAGSHPDHATAIQSK
jgi:hypothetical protein